MLELPSNNPALDKRFFQEKDLFAWFFLAVVYSTAYVYMRQFRLYRNIVWLLVKSALAWPFIDREHWLDYNYGVWRSLKTSKGAKTEFTDKLARRRNLLANKELLKALQPLHNTWCFKDIDFWHSVG